MAKVLLSPEEIFTLTTTRADLAELVEQIDIAIEAGLQSPSMAVAAREQIQQIDTLLTAFQ